VRTVEREIVGEPGVESVRFDVGHGTLTLRPSPDDKVRVRLELEARPIELGFLSFASGESQRLVDGAALGQVRDAAQLVLYAAFPAAAGDRVSERWEVEVPDRLAGLVRINVGDADVRGLRGGIDVEVNVGDARLALGVGPARVRVNVGRIEAEVEARSFGRALLGVNLGDVRAVIAGRVLPTDPAPPPTARLDLMGEGDAVHVLEVNVGSVGYSVRRPQP